MLAHRWITALLIVTWIVLDALFVSAIESQGLNWPAWPAILGMGFVFAQSTHLSAWLVWGHSNIAVRIGAGVAAMYALAYLTSVATMGTPGTSMWFGGQLIFALGALPAFLAARLRGLRFVVDAEDGVATWAAGQPIAQQYTIWGILSLTTAVAIALAAIRMTAIEHDDIVSAFIFFIMISSNGTIVFLAMFLIRNLLVVELIATVTAISLGWLCPLSGLPDDERRELVTMTLTQAIAVIGTAIVLRVGGLRSTRRRNDETLMTSELRRNAE
jgi:hypothetical protein